MILLPQKVAYRGTLTGLRISAVDGTAFLDACAALVPYADGSHLVEIYDASGRMLRGYLGAAGSGEDLGAELITSWTHNATYPYETFTVDGINITRAVNDAAGVGLASVAATINAGDLTKFTGTLTINDGTAPNVMVKNAPASSTYHQYLMLAGAYSRYWTAATELWDYLCLQNNNVAMDFAIASPSWKKVTGPSADGCTIVSAKGGAVANFAYKNASFTYNSSAYYVIVRKAR
jgi:hypothetical protein